MISVLRGLEAAASAAARSDGPRRAAEAPAAGGGPRVGRVEVVQRDVLHDLAPLVDVALGQRDVLVRLEVEAARVRLAAAEAAHGARGGLEVDDIAVFFFWGGGVARAREREREREREERERESC